MKVLLFIFVLIFCASSAMAQTQLIEPSLTTAKKTRVIKIYLYQNPNENRPEIPGRLVGVKRRIFAYEPLYRAMLSLVAGDVETDNKPGWLRIVGSVNDVNLVSARIRNGTAEINFTKTVDDSYRQWEERLLNSYFTEAVTRTARELKEVKRVSICVNGIKDYTNINRATQKKCPFEMFPAPPPRPLEPNELWTVEIPLNKNDAPFTDWGPRLTQNVKRQVRAAEYLPETFKVFTQGETKAERKMGYSTSTYGAKFISVRIKADTAYVKFMMPQGASFPDRNALKMFRYDVFSTASQFNLIRNVKICLDGVSNFDDVASKGASPQPCDWEKDLENEK